MGKSDVSTAIDTVEGNHVWDCTCKRKLIILVSIPLEKYNYLIIEYFTDHHWELHFPGVIEDNSMYITKKPMLVQGVYSLVSAMKLLVSVTALHEIGMRTP